MTVQKDDSFIEANRTGYKSGEGFLNTTKEVAGANWQYVCHHPYKTAAVVLGTLSMVALTAAYFLSPAYGGFVNTTAKSAYVGIIEGGKGLYVFAAINPVFAGLLAVAIVGAIGTLMYMNYSKAKKVQDLKFDNNEQAQKVQDLESDNTEKNKQIDTVKGLLNTETESGTTNLDVENPKTVLDKVAVAVNWKQKAQTV